VERLSQEVSKMQNVSIQANVVTVTAGTDSGIESGDEEGPPPAPGSQSEENLTKHVSTFTYTSVRLLTRQYVYLHVSTFTNTSVRLLTLQYIYKYVSTFTNTSVHCFAMLIPYL
jgi:hypothetical protein